VIIGIKRDGDGERFKKETSTLLVSKESGIDSNDLSNTLFNE
jgi:hypothetical protein